MKASRKLRWIVGLAVLLMIAVISFTPIQSVLTVQFISKGDILLIDPGHGGIDGGAESANGTSEKDINLAIGLAIKDLAEQDGWTVVMTRAEDKGLYPDRDRESIRSLKTADLLERKRIIEEVMPLLAVSVHLNSFKQDPSVHGAQTFYPSSGSDSLILEESKLLAEMIQENLIEGLADGTDREALGKRDALLLKNSPVPIVIVECGFLSNANEANLLTQEAYQKKLAVSIYQGILEYSGKEEGTPLELIDTRGRQDRVKPCA